MRILKWYVLGFLAVSIVLAIVFYSPIKFYAIKYTNRFLSANTTPIENRENERVAEFDWSLKEHGGESLNFEEFKGEVIVINFWATWCPPCIKEMPSLQALYDSYGDKVTFLFIARDKENNVTRFMAKKGYDLPVYFEDGITPKLFYNPGIPTTFILSKDGKIAMAKYGEYDWNRDEVRQLLDGLLSK